MPEIVEEINSVPFWWHSIDLGGGVVTPGQKTVELLESEWQTIRLPDLEGKTVLDVGAWDGYFAFAAERAGAARVVALDHYVWSLDFAAAGRAAADFPDACLPETLPGAWRPDTLPGKRGFDLAHRALDSAVEVVVGDFMEIDLDQLGSFDVVLFLGVLYHLRHPLLALERLRRLTRELAVIESEAVSADGADDRPWCLFVEGRDENTDPTNWWIPSGAALTGMCRAAGFGRAELLTAVPEAVPRFRAIAHARP